MAGKFKFTRKRLTATIVWTAVAVFVTVYIGYHLLKGFAPLYDTGVVVRTEETLVKSFDAVVLRDEHEVCSAYAETYGSGNVFCDYLVPDGGYSKTDAPLVNVYHVENAEKSETVARIREIDARVKILEESAVRLSAAGIGDAKKQISSAYLGVADASARRNVKTAADSISGVAELLYTLNGFNVGAVADCNAAIAEASREIETLKLERQELCASLGTPETIRSETTGNFFYDNDGYETVLTSAGIDDKSLEDIALMFASVSRKNESAIGRFSTMYTWYLAVPTDLDTAASFSLGGRYSASLSCDGGETVDLKLERVARSDTAKDAIMLFSCGRTVTGIGTRKLTVNFKVAGYSGFRISSDAISRRGGRDGVWVIYNSRASWRYVSVIYKNELYCVVALSPDTPLEEDDSYIGINDIYIKSGKGLYEGMMIK